MSRIHRRNPRHGRRRAERPGPRRRREVLRSLRAEGLTTAEVQALRDNLPDLYAQLVASVREEMAT